MQPPTIRAFIALDLPDAITAVLAQTAQIIGKQLPNGAVRWVKPDRMHLTLRFLGETAVNQLPTIANELDRLTSQQPPFNLYLNELGCFPNSRKPRVIWAGLAGDVPPLQTLKRGIDAFLAPLGWEPEKRPFQAHLTLGRVKDARQWQHMQWNVAVKKVAWSVTAVHLIESQLRPQGPIYTTRHSSHLRLAVANRKS
jgi:2'-5' RNA ligase